MYETGKDPYCYPNSSVLINRLDLGTEVDLDKAERVFTARRAREPLPIGRLSYAHYRKIHRHLFQDVYQWAGRIRTVRMFKDGSPFCFPEYIDRQMHDLFEELADNNKLRDLTAETFSREAAHFLAELNVIHPFREGNGRTQSLFLNILADQAGHPLDFERLDPPEMLAAVIASFYSDERPLSDLIRSLIRGV